MVFYLSLSHQKLPLSKESAWAFLAFSHLLVGLCHPFPLTNSPVQIIIAHENKENATAQLEILGTGEMSQACSVFSFPQSVYADLLDRGRNKLKEGSLFHLNKYNIYYIGQIIALPMSLAMIFHWDSFCIASAYTVYTAETLKFKLLQLEMSN